MPTKLYNAKTAPLPRDVIEGWSNVPASIAADLFEGRTLIDVGIRPLRPLGNGQRLIGPVITALCSGADYGAVHHAIAVAAAGAVIVVEAGGRDNPAVIGELLGGAARLKGVAGVVVNGAVRDTAHLCEWDDFLVFTRHVTPRGPSSMEHGSVNDVISFANVRVAPGDLILGDDDGVVIIPREDAEAQLQAAHRRIKAEQDWERELASGRSTLDVFSVPGVARG